MLTEKQERFCAEYLKDLDANGAARRAGYAGRGTGERLMGNARVRERIEALSGESGVAGAGEVLATLTNVLRGEDSEPKVAERIRAAELLGKHYGLFSERVDMNVAPPRIVDDITARREGSAGG